MKTDYDNEKSETIAFESLEETKNVMSSNGLEDVNNFTRDSDAKWVDNEGMEIEKVFGFNKNSELVNGRAAMIGFLMLVLTELIFKGIFIRPIIIFFQFYSFHFF